MKGWVGLVGSNMPLDTLEVISETSALCSHLHYYHYIVKMATMLHVGVRSYINMFNTMMAELSKIMTDRLSCKLSAAACIVSGTHKFIRSLTHLLHSELQWMDIPQRVQDKQFTDVYSAELPSPLRTATQYTLTSNTANQPHLHSASRSVHDATTSSH